MSGHASKDKRAPILSIATLGYGDIVLVGELAQGVTILEAVCGQLYLTPSWSLGSLASMPSNPDD
jgi:hypothetical protein